MKLLNEKVHSLGSFLDEKKIKEILGIPRSKKVELVLTVGYVENTLRNKSRKPAEEVISFNKY